MGKVRMLFGLVACVVMVTAAGRDLKDSEAVILDTGEFLVDTSASYMPVPGNQEWPAVACGGSGCLVVWKDSRRGDTSDIYGALIAPGGFVLDPAGVAISTAPGNQESPAVAFDGTNSLVVWQDCRNGPAADIYGARVTPSGGVLDVGGIAISTAASRQDLPAVAFGGTDFLVVWADSRSGNSDIYGARVTPSCVVLDSSGFVIRAIGGSQASPAVAFDGTNFLAVWEDCRGSYTDILGARVTPGGVVLDSSGIVVSAAARNQGQPEVAFDGTNFLVVWEDGRSASPDIYGARVTSTGTVLDSSGIAISLAVNSQLSPAVAFDGLNFLVVWEDGWSGGPPDIYGARVTPGGVVLDAAGIPVSTAAGDQRDPSVTFDGRNSFVAWQDYRGGPESDIYGARLTRGGRVVESLGVVTQTGNQMNPRLCNDGNQVFLAYQGWAGTVGGKTYNADRIWGKINPNPGIEDGPRSPAGNPSCGHDTADKRSRNPLIFNGGTIVAFAAEWLFGRAPRPGVSRCGPEPTIIRSVLMVPAANGEKRTVTAELLDISGREVMVLRPGPNDVRALAPGVYFVREQSVASSQHSGSPSVRKVVLTE